MKLHNSDENFYSIKPTANVGRATVWRGEVTPRRDEDRCPPILVGTVADPTIREKTERHFCFNKIDPPKADINFRHFRHFAILGISNCVPLIL